MSPSHIPLNSDPTNSSIPPTLSELTTVELATALLEQLAINERDWHRLKSNRPARAAEQIASALVFLLKDQPTEVIPRLNQAIGWLDRSISAPPCPSHGNQGKSQSD
ncbi:MAG: DUF6439 family protein [Microcoleaceae cyanobacterium]